MAGGPVSLGYPDGGGRRAAWTFDLQDLAELLAYLRPGAGFLLPPHLCEALFPGAAVGEPGDILARCDAWARERHCIPRSCPRTGGIDFTRLGERAKVSAPGAAASCSA